MVALVATVESLLAGSRADFVTPSIEDWRLAAVAAKERAPGADVLCFGDSLIKFGVLPRVLRDRAGLRAYNLAVSDGSAPSSYFLLERALASGARPRAVVVDFDALMIREAPGSRAMPNYPELATIGDCFGLARATRDPEFLGASVAGKLLPSARWRWEIRSSLRAALGGRNGSERESVRIHTRHWSRESGAHPAEPGRSRPSNEASLIAGVCPESWECEPVERDYIERFLGLAESRRIPVFWLLPPLAPEVHQLRAARGSDAIYSRFVRSIAERHPGVVVVDARGSAGSESTHVDHIHLDRRGASALTADLASIVMGRTPIEPDRWVALASLDGRLGDDPGSAIARSRGDLR
jgi:hypothetical protein